MTSMHLKSDAEWWADFARAEGAAARRRHPAGRARTPMDIATPMDTAQAFHDDVAEIDAQTGRVLPRRILPPVADEAEPQWEEPSILEVLSVGVVWGLLSLAFGWVLFAVFYGWEGLV